MITCGSWQHLRWYEAQQYEPIYAPACCCWMASKQRWSVTGSSCCLDDACLFASWKRAFVIVRASVCCGRVLFTAAPIAVLECSQRLSFSAGGSDSTLASNRETWWLAASRYSSLRCI